MRSVYVGILTLFLLGFGLSLYLVLSPEDYALMLLKGKKYSAAEDFYKEKYAKGDRSTSISIPLQTLDIAEGDNDKAIAIMEEYVSTHLTDVHARNLLGVLYLNSEKRDQYLANLEEIKKLDPNQWVLQELQGWYEVKGEKEKQEAILREILAKKYATAQNYTSLAYLLASKQEYAAALQLLEEQEKVFPASVTVDFIEFELALLQEMANQTGNRQEYDEKMLAIVRQYIMSSKKAYDASDLLSTLVDQKRSDLAYRLIPSVKYLAKSNQGLTTLMIELEWQQGDKKLAYNQLLQLYSQGPLNAKLSDLLANMALEKKYYLILDNLLDHSTPSWLSESTYLWIAEISSEKKNPALIVKAESRLGQTYLRSHPVIQTAFLLAQRDPKGEELLRKLISTHALSSSQALPLMQLAADNGYKNLVLELGDSLHFSRISEDELVAWALIYINLDEPAKGIKILQAQQNEISKGREGSALALLNLALGNVEEARSWFLKQKNISKEVLANFYSLSQKIKNYPLELQSATLLYERYPSIETELYYATALLDNGKCAEALVDLRQLIKTVRHNKIDVEMQYLKALFICRENNKEELNSFLTYLLASPLKENELRDIGYLVLEKLHDFEKAEEIFWKLAQKSHKFSDIESLLYLLGPRPSAEVVAFVTEEAQKARDDEKMKWIKTLQNIHQYAAALKLFMGTPTTAWTNRDYLLWLELLSQLQDKESLKKALGFLFCYLTDVKDLTKALEYAEELNLINLQREILTTLVCKFPERPLFWQSLGKVAYNLGDFTCALEYFNRYFSFECFDKDYYLILFLYGEILLTRNDPLKANDYYETSLETIAQNGPTIPSYKQEPQNPAAQLVQATIYARLRQKWLGVQQIASIYEEAPNPDVRAAWANALIEKGDLNAARYVLYDVCDMGYVKEESLLIQWKGPVEATATAKPTEVLIETSIPIEESNLKEVLKHLPPGFKEVETGHHTLLISTASPADFFVTTEKDLASGAYFLRICTRLYPTPFPPNLAIGIARVNLALNERHYTYACHLVGQLLERYPDNVDVLNLVAAIEGGAGKWQGGLHWLAKAHAVAPRNENVWVAFRDMYFPVSSFVDYEQEAMLTKKTSAEQFYRLQGEWILSRNIFRFLYLHVKTEMVRAHISTVFNDVGLSEGFLGNRSRSQLRARSVNFLGTEYEASLYVGEGVIGGGAAWLTRFDQGTLTIYGDWNKPYWEILECLVHDGMQNRAGIIGSYICNARLDGFLDYGFRQYGEQRARHATSTLILQGDANYKLKITDPYFVLNYTLDAEYVFAIEEKLNPFGQAYQPVPLTSRENHTIRLMLRTVWHKWWEFGGYFGETFNRLGTHNFTAGLNFHYHYPCGLECDLVMERYPSTTITGAQVNDIRGKIKWRF